MAAVAFEQAGGKFLFQMCNLPAESRLGGVHGPSGATEAPGLGNGYKRSEEVQFHSCNTVILLLTHGKFCGMKHEKVLQGYHVEGSRLAGWFVSRLAMVKEWMSDETRSVREAGH